MIGAFLLKALPLHLISGLFGVLAEVRLPKPFNTVVLLIFAKLFGISIGAASKPLAAYRSLNEFFTRDLRPEARIIADQGLLSPCDGFLREAGPVQNGEIRGVKGQNYTVFELLGGVAEASRFQEGVFFNFYLSPRDYHHVHAPATGEITARIHIPGSLFPVNAWSLGRIPKLFPRNERVVILMWTEFGLAAVVMVGATNVGKITLTFDSLVTNQLRGARSGSEPVRLEFTPGRQIKAGARLGTFNLGSTVVLLLESRAIKPLLESNREVLFGQRIGAVVKAAT